MKKYPVRSRNPGIMLLVFAILSASLMTAAPASAGSQARPLSPDITPSDLFFQEVASGLSNPIFITHAGDGSDRLFILERAGRIRILKDGALLPGSFLDITSIVNSSGGEQGLLTLAFHPDYESNGYFYIVYNNAAGSIVLARVTRSASNPNLASAASRVTLLTIPKPFANHNGGTLAFGQDGYLYWSTGDGGSGGDPNNYAQSLDSLLGKILRLDVDSAFPYDIPATNPFVGDPGVYEEIWAYGLRNPWRFSFDRLTHDLYIGDVGQNSLEEIDFQPAASTGGENYGWRVMEGTQCYNPSSGCDTFDKEVPIAEYSHSLGCSVTGGYVYRGRDYPAMDGLYFYADYCTGRLFRAYFDSGWVSGEILDTSFGINTFGEDEQGELYLANYFDGRIYQIQYLAPPPNDEIADAENLSAIPAATGIGTRGATVAGDDVPVTACNLQTGQASVWYTYTPASDGYVSFDTLGSDYDTYLAIWSGSPGSLSPVACNDDWTGSILQSVTGANLTNGVTYYIQASQFNGWITGTPDKPVPGSNFGGSLDLHASATVNVDVAIAANPPANYFIPEEEVLIDRYAGLLDGPVTVNSANLQPVFASQRVTSGDSYNELMGVPPGDFTTEYWFPWYDHGYPVVGGSSMRTWVLVGNPDESLSANVDIYIGGSLMNSYVIPPGDNITPRWIGLQAGPVRVVSDIPVFASERVFTVPNNSFNEIMGYPADQFTSEYWFPWYDSINMNASVMVGNTSSTLTADVDIYIGAALMDSYTIPANDTLIQSFPSTLNGPVRVVATNAVDIVASEAAMSGPTGSFTAYNEVMGYPFDQFDTEYWFPAYDHGYPSETGSNMRMWILVGNPSGASTANVNIFIDGVLQGSYAIPPNSRVTPRWIGLQDGPVQVVSDIPVFTSQRVFTTPGNVFNEMMGYPASGLTDEYWFSWYDSVNMNTDVLVSFP